MLINEIAPVNTGGAFIIDVNENMSNTDASLTIPQQYASGFPKQAPYVQTSKTFKACFTFKNHILDYDYSPPTAEYTAAATKLLVQFSEELHNISKNQPVYLRFHIPPEVNDITNSPLDVLIPVTFQYQDYITGYDPPSWRIVGQTTDITNKIRVHKCFALAYANRTPDPDNPGHHKVFVQLQIQFILVDTSTP